MLNLDKKVTAVIDYYHQRIAEEAEKVKALSFDEKEAIKNDLLLQVGEETGIFLNTLIKATKAKNILELGTSYGYSTVWLAEAAKANEGKVISLELDAEKSKFAQEKLTEAGLNNFVDFRIGNALEILKNLNQHFDFVLVDIWKDLYAPCFDLFLPLLNKGAWVVADNMIFPPQSQEETKRYSEKITGSNQFQTILLPIGSGLELSKFTP